MPMTLPPLAVVLAVLVQTGGPAFGGGPVAQGPTYSEVLLLAAAGRITDLTRVRTGVADLRAGRGSAAARSFDEAASALPGLSDWLHLLAADAAARSGDTASVASHLAHSEPVLVRDAGWRIMADARRAAGDIAGAIRSAEWAIATLSDTLRRAEAARAAGTLYLLRADSAAAAAAYRTAIELAPGVPGALDAARGLVSLRQATAQDRLLAGRLFFRHGNPDRGMAGIDAFARTRPAPERGSLQIEVARGLYQARRYTQAETRVRPLLADTASPVWAEAMLLLGRIQVRRGQAEVARQTFRRAATRGAASVRADATYALADLEHDRRALTAATALYRQVLSLDPTGSAAVDAAMRLGAIEMAAGRHFQAAGVFDTPGRGNGAEPRWQQAGFWAARALLLAGDSAEAVARFAAVQRTDPVSFYGLRAAEAIGLSLHASLVPSPAAHPMLARRAAGAVARIVALAQVGLTAEETAEIERARSWFGARPGGLYELAEALNARGRTLDAVRTGRAIRRAEGEWNDRLLRIVYPLPFRDEIFAAATRRGVDPFLVAGLIRQESLFQPAARSSAGAVGLTQIMPPTGRMLARQDGLAGYAPAMLRDPSVNLSLGTLFIADLLRRHGEVAYALAAYNAGPSRLNRWRDPTAAEHPDLFAERIPFAETRDYVRTVQQNAIIYAALYRENPVDDRK